MAPEDVKKAKRVKKEPTVKLEGDAGDGPGFSFQLCSEKDDAERLATKEQAVQRAGFYTHQLCTLLRQYTTDSTLPGMDALRDWIAMIDDLQKADDKFKVLVGVVGATGAGKTSLLNAILGISELLPSGQEQAATAVACEVQWNHDERPGYECRAAIIFQTASEILDDIVLTLSAIKFRNDVENMVYEDEDKRVEAIATATTQMREGLTKILAVWPLEEDAIMDMAVACDTEDKLNDAARKVLKSSADVVKMIRDGVKSINTSNGEDLGKLIKPFLDSTTARHGDSGEFAAWPLIKNVQLYLRSDILRTGIHLVNLPGFSDNVESRSEIAERYRDRLDVTLLVSQIYRATDEKSTQKLIGEYSELRMQLGSGGASKYHLGVVLSKMDDMDVDTYIRRSKDALNDPELEGSQDVIEASREKLGTLDREKKQVVRNIKKAKAKLARVKEKLANPMSKSGKARKPSAIEELENAKFGLKASLDADQSSLQAYSHHEATEQQSLREAQMHLTHWALRTRNRFVRQRIQDSFERRQRQLMREAKISEQPINLDVMASSVRAFWDLKALGKPSPGFPTEVYTGVPYIRQWLHHATASRREEHLDFMLRKLETSLNAIQNWCGTTKVDLNINIDPQEVEVALNATHQRFNKDLRAVVQGLHTHIMENINPLQRREMKQSEFKRQSSRAANSWSLKYPDDESQSQRLAWSTYQAIVSRAGGPFTSPANRSTTYDWVTKFALLLLKQILSDWRQQVNTQLPTLWNMIQDPVQHLWNEYIDKLESEASQFHPALTSHFTDLRSQLGIGNNYIQSNVANLLRELSNGMRECHREVKGSLKSSLRPLFGEARDIRGPGSYQIKRTMLEKEVPKAANEMFGTCWSSVDQQLKKKKAESAPVLEKIADKAIQDVKIQIALHLHNLLGKGSSGGKLNVKDKVRSLIRSWRDDWAFPPGDFGHILKKDLGIPEVLRLEDLAAMRQDMEDSDSDKDSDDSDKDNEAANGN